MSHTHAGRTRQAAKARRLATGIASLEGLDDSTLDEIFCRVSALYQAAYMPLSARHISNEEALIRMALPWHMAPTLLARMNTHDAHCTTVPA
jgi:hypothetical protein